MSCAFDLIYVNQHVNQHVHGHAMNPSCGPGTDILHICTSGDMYALPEYLHLLAVCLMCFCLIRSLQCSDQKPLVQLLVQHRKTLTALCTMIP